MLFWTGCKFFFSKFSTVIKCLAFSVYRKVIHVFILLYLILLFVISPTTAVQAPQSPEPQPSFVPVNFLTFLK